MNDMTVRRYRFAPAGRPGLFGLIPPSQIAVAASGALVGWIAAIAGVFPPLAAVPALVSVTVAFKRLRGHPLYELLPRWVTWRWRRHRYGGRWCRPIPLLGANDHVPIALPPVMRGLRLVEQHAPTDGRPIGVVVDHTAGTATMVLAVHGDGQFSLADPVEQERRVALWGDALAAFCRERPTVTRITWHEWTTRSATPINTSSIENGTRAANDYAALVASIDTMLTNREIHVTITVQLADSRRRTRALENAIGVLVDEARLFSGRLERAGLAVGASLTPVEITHLVRARSDPSTTAALAAWSRSLAALSGRAAVDFGPMAVDDAWDHVTVNGATHRSWWVQGWPRLDVPASWMDALLARTSGTRAVTVVFEPIAPSVALRAAERDAVRLEATEHSRQRRGFRTPASDRRARTDVEAREHELTAGYGDLAYAGFVTITTPNPDALADLAADTEQTAAQTGVLLDPLDGRQAAGWMASLPVGRTVANQHHRA